MKRLPSSSCVRSRLLLATVLLLGTVTVAGCTTSTEYTTTIEEPTNGSVIDTLTVSDINEIDGARYELQYSLDAGDDQAYNIEVYELTSGSPEFVSISDLDRGESTHRNDVPPPWDAGDERRYEIRVIQEDTGTVVDAVTFSIERVES